MKRSLIPLNPSDRTDGSKMRVKLIGFSLTLAVMVVPMRGLGGESSACLAGLSMSRSRRGSGRSSGMPLSGGLRHSVSTAADSFSFLTSRWILAQTLAIGSRPDPSAAVSPESARSIGAPGNE